MGMYGKLETETLNGGVCIVLSRGELVKRFIWDGRGLRPLNENKKSALKEASGP